MKVIAQTYAPMCDGFAFFADNDYGNDTLKSYYDNTSLLLIKLPYHPKKDNLYIKVKRMAMQLERFIQVK